MVRHLRITYPGAFYHVTSSDKNVPALKELTRQAFGVSFSIGVSGVCQASRIFEERIHQDRALKMEVRKIENELV
jgi:hypothetical protein